MCRVLQSARRKQAFTFPTECASALCTFGNAVQTMFIRFSTRTCIIHSVCCIGNTAPLHLSALVQEPGRFMHPQIAQRHHEGARTATAVRMPTPPEYFWPGNGLKSAVSRWKNSTNLLVNALCRICAPHEEVQTSADTGHAHACLLASLDTWRKTQNQCGSLVRRWSTMHPRTAGRWHCCKD